MNKCEISVAIPTYNRLPQLLQSLEKILKCDPIPNEIIIHIDNNDSITEEGLKNNKFADIKIIKNSIQVGPGGGRNIAISHANNSIVASFDDDSYPIDTDYFARLIQLFEQFPQAAVIGAVIFHQNEIIEPDNYQIRREHSFVGCGCAYRKSVFEKLQGYVELPLAYGMEEIDLSLRLYDVGYKVLVSPWLRVFHDTNLSHHQQPKITAASISNQVLLTFLRYPVSFWGLGLAQTLNRIIWLIRHRRLAGIVQGIANIPTLIIHNKQCRSVVKTATLNDFLQLKRQPITEILN